jgi:hypothetical protein
VNDYDRILPVKLRIILFAMVLLLVLPACSSDRQPAQSDPISSPDQSPEFIVQAFLTDFQEAPMQLDGYLSTALRGLYPPEQRGDLLPVSGMIEGFAIQSAAITPSDAEIEVAIRSAGEDSILQFNLIKEKGYWVIDSVFPSTDPLAQ